MMQGYSPLWQPSIWAMWAMHGVQQQLKFDLSTKILATVKTDQPL